MSISDGLADQQRLNVAILAASRGVYAAVRRPEEHLGDAARRLGYQSRTLGGDAFETAFEWAR